MRVAPAGSQVGQGSLTEPTTALAYSTKRVPRAAGEESVAAILARLGSEERYDSATDIAVIEDGQLIGLIPIEDLLAAGPAVRAREIMDPDPPVIAPGIDQEAAAAKAVSHQESSLGIVAADGTFLGLIPPHRMLGVLLDEHHEDLARISGYLHESSSARSASEERLVRRFWHRFPWLLLGLVAAMAAAAIVSGFERGLTSHVELVFFIPGIVYIADAVGTQTETLVVRGLSVGVSVKRVMGRELVTGLVLGATLGALAYPAVAIWVDQPVAVVVAGSICAASAVATGVAMALPWLLARLNCDPAFGSGPLSTVIQDLLSLTIYFLLASAIVL